jgi:hypothetical protein
MGIMKPISIALAGLALSFLAACNSGGTAPPKTDAEKSAMAAEVANLMSDPKMIDQMFSSTTAAMMPAMNSACDMAPPDQRVACRERLTATQPVIQEIVDEMMTETKGLMPELMKDMGAIMAETYSGEELAKMKDFYSSPEGKSLLKKQPQVMAAFMPKVMERMQPIQSEMMRKMAERLKELNDPSPTPN